MPLLILSMILLSSCVTPQFPDRYPQNYQSGYAPAPMSEADKDRAAMLEMARRQAVGQIFQNQPQVWGQIAPQVQWQSNIQRYQPMPTPQNRTTICNTQRFGSTWNTSCY